MTHVSRNKMKFVDFFGSWVFFRIRAILMVISLIRIHQLTLIANTGLIIDYFKYHNFITAISLCPPPKDGKVMFSLCQFTGEGAGHTSLLSQVLSGGNPVSGPRSLLGGKRGYPRWHLGVLPASLGGPPQPGQGYPSPPPLASIGYPPPPSHATRTTFLLSKSLDLGRICKYISRGYNFQLTSAFDNRRYTARFYLSANQTYCLVDCSHRRGKQGDDLWSRRPWNLLYNDTLFLPGDPHSSQYSPHGMVVSCIH